MSKSKKTVGFLDFFIFRAKLVFTKLRQAFVKAPIIHHFNLKHHIQIKIDESGYIINRILNEQVLDDLSQ